MALVESKGALRSTTIIGAILTLVGAIGIFPAGVTYDPVNHDLIINLDSLFAWLALLAIPGGAGVSWFGRLIAAKVIKGLW